MVRPMLSICCSAQNKGDCVHDTFLVAHISACRQPATIIPMRYTLTAEALDPESRYCPYGVEIQPPLSRIAISGLCQALMHRPPAQEEYPTIPSAIEAYVTRNDREGTVLFIQPNPDLGWHNENLRDIQQHAFYVAQDIQYLIDPTSQHEIEIYPPDPNGWNQQV
jgi:hypothetical protein